MSWKGRAEKLGAQTTEDDEEFEKMQRLMRGVFGEEDGALRVCVVCVCGLVVWLVTSVRVLRGRCHPDDHPP